MTSRFLPVILAIFLICILVPGCSVVQSVNQMRDGEKELLAAEKAGERGDYTMALISYHRAVRYFQAARENGLTTVVDDRKMEEINASIRKWEKKADAAGLVRVGDLYLGGADLTCALDAGLRELIDDGRIESLPVERLVPRSIAVTSKKGTDNKYTVGISLVLKEIEGESDFSQDAWTIVRLLLEGAFGYGFAYHMSPAFGERPWMGKEGGWGTIDGSGVENHPIGLKDKIAELNIDVYRGRYRQGKDKKYGSDGHLALRAAGPYWKKELFRRYTMDVADAELLNWEEAGRIPDVTLYAALKISDGLPPKKDREEK